MLIGKRGTYIKAQRNQENKFNLHFDSLEIRAHEGRIEKDDLIIAGLDSLAFTENQLQGNDTKEVLAF